MGANGKLNIGLIGFGNIGCGVVRTLADQKPLLDSRLPREMELIAIADRDVTTHRDVPYDLAILHDDAAAVLENPEVDVVIELVGGEEPARTFVERALKAGKHVVTANKALMALHGPELLAVAEANGVGLLFEAAVGGGIPIIRGLEQGLAANELTTIQGILNGTCNYILTQMGERGIPFDQALEEAKEKGYAEPDPTYDIEGYDTAHKTAILASLAFGMDIRFSDVYVEGITKIQPIDISTAREMGYKIKLLGIARRDSLLAPAEVRVHPTLVPCSSPIGQVDGVFNAVYCDGRPIGPTLFYGQGAGPAATSSAVVSDLMALAADVEGFNSWRDARLQIPVGEKNIKSIDEMETHYYIRTMLADSPGTMAMLGQILADQKISIESMIQHRTHTIESLQPATVSIVTHRTTEGQIRKAVAAIEADERNRGEAFVLRVEE